MPPKKKEEEFDLATLPPWTSKNCMIVCSGLKSRATQILEQIKKQPNRLMKFISRQDIIDHAKEKSMYVDPATLTDKQKKDTKFMSQVCTQLTPEVMAKATQSYVFNVLNGKYRIERKMREDPPKQEDKKAGKKEPKKQEKKEEIKPVEEKQYKKLFDSIYVFDSFPATMEQNVELAKVGEGISFIINIKPTVNIPKPAEDEQEDEEQALKLKNLQQRETPKQEDTEHQQKVNNFIVGVQTQRRQSPQTSEFRNTLIKDFVIQIDPATEKQQLAAISESLFQFLCELSIERGSFDEWLKGKQKSPLLSKPLGELQSPTLKSASSKTPLSLLLDMAQDIEVADKSTWQLAPTTQKDIDDLLDMAPLELRRKTTKTETSREALNAQLENKAYVYTYDWHGKHSHQPQIQTQILSWLRYPGLHRVMMPEIPEKSKHMRKMQAAEYINFIGEGSLEKFDRANKLIYFQKMISAADEFRQYDFGDRVYEERLDKKALASVLHQGLLQHPELISKYNPKEDSLYVGLLHKKPPGGVLQKKWAADWKVMPNFQNWINYFKNNETNYKNNEFYDIDYQKLAAIGETHRVVYPSDGSMITVERKQVGNQAKINVKIKKNDLTWGLNNIFWHHSDGVRITVEKDGDSSKIYVTMSNGLIMVLSSNGQVYQTYNQQPGRVTLPSGHCISYGSSSQVQVQHPNGGLSHPPFQYTTTLGYGQKQGKMQQVPTLKRTTKTHGVIKRDDDTIIVEKGDKKWITFHDGAEIQQNPHGIVIEYGELARWTSMSNLGFKLNKEDLEIVARNEGGKYVYSIKLSNDSQVIVKNQDVYCLDGSEKAQLNITGQTFESWIDQCAAIYKCSLAENKVQIEKITVYSNGNIEQIQQGKLRVIDSEMEQPEDELKALPLSLQYIEPRLLIIYPDNTGIELLSEKQVSEYRRQISQFAKNALKRDSATMSIATELAPKAEKKVIKPQLPKNLDVLPDHKNEANTAKDKKIFQLRILDTKQKLDQASRNELQKIHQAYEQWKAEDVKYNNQYGFMELTPAIIENSMKIKERALEQRRKATPENPLTQRVRNLIDYVQKQNQEKQKQKNKAQNQNKVQPSVDQENNQVSQLEPKKNRKRYVIEKQSPLSKTCFNFFATDEGKKVLSEMPDWVFKPKQRKDRASINIDDIRKPSADSELPRQKSATDLQQQPQQTNQQTMPNLVPSKIVIKPSVFTQQDIDQERQVFEEEKKAFQYREVKRKDFDVYGRPRSQKMTVPAMMRTQPISQLNQKYILTEAQTDKKIRIASMKNKLTMNAPGVSELRNEGMHQTLMRSIDMGSGLEDQAERKNLMIYADINDKLRRDILINPTEANFGVIKENSVYEVKIEIKNEDVLCQRVVVKRPRTNFVRAFLNQMGPIPLGISRKVIIQLRTTPDIRGKFSDEFQIVSKHEIYHIPVVAQIVSEEVFGKMGEQQAGRSMLKTGIIELKQRTSTTELLPRIDKP